MWKSKCLLTKKNDDEWDVVCRVDYRIAMLLLIASTSDMRRVTSGNVYKPDKASKFTFYCIFSIYSNPCKAFFCYFWLFVIYKKLSSWVDLWLSLNTNMEHFRGIYGKVLAGIWATWACRSHFPRNFSVTECTWTLVIRLEQSTEGPPKLKQLQALAPQVYCMCGIWQSASME